MLFLLNSGVYWTFTLVHSITILVHLKIFVNVSSPWVAKCNYHHISCIYSRHFCLGHSDVSGTQWDLARILSLNRALVAILCPLELLRRWNPCNSPSRLLTHAWRQPTARGAAPSHPFLPMWLSVLTFLCAARWEALGNYGEHCLSGSVRWRHGLETVLLLLDSRLEGNY